MCGSNRIKTLIPKTRNIFGKIVVALSRSGMLDVLEMSIIIKEKVADVFIKGKAIAKSFMPI